MHYHLEQIAGRVWRPVRTCSLNVPTAGLETVSQRARGLNVANGESPERATQNADRKRFLSPLIVDLHLFFRCRPLLNLVVFPVRRGFMNVGSLADGLCERILALQRSEHASSHYEFVAPASRWLPEGFRVGRCALVRQRILRCRPHRGLYYKGCAGPKPACSH
jgi:hypothetical protein